MIYRGYDIRINPNLTDWVIRHHGEAIVAFEPTQLAARRWVDQQIHEERGRMHARLEGRERK